MIAERGGTWLGLIAVISAMARAAGPDGLTSQPAILSGPTVAVLTFESDLQKPEKAGEMIADVLSARLGALGDFVVVERKDINKIFAEQRLKLEGLVPSHQAVKVGRLLSAQLLVAGRVTQLGTSVYVICKVMSAETAQVKGLFFSLPQDVSLEQLLNTTGAKLAESLPTWSRQLIPPEQRGPNDVSILKKELMGREMPKVAVVIQEQHIGPQVMDPAVETEFKTLLTRVGIRPVELSETAAREASKDLKDVSRLSRLLPGTRYLICGEAFSERGGSAHELVIGLARAEVKVIDLQTGETVLAERDTARAPDLSEHLASKTALQLVGRRLAMRLLPKLIAEFPPKANAATGKGAADATATRPADELRSSLRP